MAPTVETSIEAYNFARSFMSFRGPNKDTLDVNESPIRTKSEPAGSNSLEVIGTDYGKFSRLNKDIENEEVFENRRLREEAQRNNAMMSGCAHDHSKERQLFEKSTVEKIEAADRFRKEGNLAFKEKNYGLAAVNYRKALLQFDYTFPDTEDEEKALAAVKLPCHLNLAASKLQQRDYDEVCIQCRLALQMDPSNCKALYRRGVAQMAQDHLADAQESFREALVVEPANPHVLDAIKQLRSKQDRYRRRTREACRKMFGTSNEEQSKSSVPPTNYNEHRDYNQMSTCLDGLDCQNVTIRSELSEVEHKADCNRTASAFRSRATAEMPQVARNRAHGCGLEGKSNERSINKSEKCDLYTGSGDVRHVCRSLDDSSAVHLPNIAFDASELNSYHQESPNDSLLVPKTTEDCVSGHQTPPLQATTVRPWTNGIENVMTRYTELMATHSSVVKEVDVGGAQPRSSTNPSVVLSSPSAFEGCRTRANPCDGQSMELNPHEQSKTTVTQDETTLRGPLWLAAGVAVGLALSQWRAISQHKDFVPITRQSQVGGFGSNIFRVLEPAQHLLTVAAIGCVAAIIVVALLLLLLGRHAIECDIDVKDDKFSRSRRGAQHKTGGIRETARSRQSVATDETASAAGIWINAF